MSYRIRQLEHFCDEYKSILDISNDNLFYNECISKGYSIEKLSTNKKISSYEYISIYQNKKTRKQETPISYILSKATTKPTKTQVIKINSTYTTCFGVTADQIIESIPKSDNLKVINLNKNPSIKDNNKYKIDIVILASTLNQQNFRVGDNISLPMNKLNVYLFCKLDEHCIHPFYLGARIYLKTKNRNEVFKMFENYRKNSILFNSNEGLGLEEFNIFPTNGSLYDSVLPWINLDREDYCQLHKSWAIEKNIIFNLNKLENFGSEFCTSRKSVVETKRICNIVDGFLSGSLNKDNPNLNCAVYLYNNDFQASAEDGNHRSAVLAALGVTNAKYNITKVVRLSELEKWKHVKNKLYSSVAAEHLFKNIFYSKPKIYHNKWKDIVLKNGYLS